MPSGVEGFRARALAKKRKVKRAKLWLADVDRGAPGLAQWGGPRLVLNVDGRAFCPEGPAQFPEDAKRLRPARTPKSSPVARSSPSQPWLAGTQKRITVESQLEAMHASVIDRDEGIEAILGQPLWISYQLGRKWSWACPDLLVKHRTHGWTVIESKPRSQFQAEATLAKYDAIRTSLRAWDLPLEVLHELAPGTTLNYELLHSERRPPLHLGRYGDLLLRACAERCSLKELFDLGPRTCVAPVVWHLIWKGELCLTWENPITLNTYVRRHNSVSSQCRSVAKWCGTAICGPLLA